MKKREFPHEIFFNIEDSDHVVGRITIDKVGEKFNSEIALVQRENNKIVHHVGNLYNHYDYDELFKTSLQKLATFLQCDLGEKQFTCW